MATNNHMAMTDNQMTMNDNNMAMGSHQPEAEAKMRPPLGASHQLPAGDPENPHNWPISKKVFVSAVATAFAFVV